MTRRPVDPSYRALLAVPTLGRIVLGMGLARIAQAMLGVALVLFTLAEYRSPELAGLVTFASIFPGIAISPIAGVLLDRHGRIRLMIADYLCGCDRPRPDRDPGKRPCAATVAARAHRGRDVADVDLQCRRAADAVPVDRAAQPLGAGQRPRLERLRRGDDLRATARGDPGRAWRRRRGAARGWGAVRADGPEHGRRARSADRGDRHGIPAGRRARGRDLCLAEQDPPRTRRDRLRPQPVRRHDDDRPPAARPAPARRERGARRRDVRDLGRLRDGLGAGVRADRHARPGVDHARAPAVRVRGRRRPHAAGGAGLRREPSTRSSASP